MYLARRGMNPARQLKKALLAKVLGAPKESSWRVRNKAPRYSGS